MLRPLSSFRSWAQERPDDLAIVGPDLQLSAGELWDTALRIVGWLRELGVQREEAVGANVPPTLHPAFLIALLARGGVGALVSSNIEIGPDAPIQRLVTIRDAPTDPSRGRVIQFDDTAIAQMSMLNPADVEVADTEPDDVIWLIYSSGTTGAPKAVMRTASAVEALANPRRLHLARSAYFSLQPGTVAGSMSAFLAAMMAQRQHLMAGTPEQNLQTLLSRQIEITEGSPFQFDQLLAAARRTGERLPALRELHSAGAPLSDGLAFALKDWFGAEVYDVYGSSETGYVGTRNVVSSGEENRGAVVDDDVDVEIVDDKHNPVPDGQDGRVRLRSPSMGVGYVGNPDIGPFKGFHSGWFYPGDLGRLANLELFVLGREDDLMNVGGRKILPHIVEEVVRQQPGIEDAVACAVTDRLGVRQLAIAIVGAGVTDPMAFAQQLRQPLGGIQPSLILRLKSIPRAETGKPRRDEVAGLLQKHMDRPGPIL